MTIISSKPEGIPQDIRHAASECADAICCHDGDLTFRAACELEIARAIMAAKAEVLPHHDLVDCLSDMTEHYVRLAGCGDCGFWDPEGEAEVIAARRMIAAHRNVNAAHKNSEEV